MTELATKKEGLNCPICHVSLTMTERKGIEIDYCPTCRGIWLDRGELDKIIERSIENDGSLRNSTNAPEPGRGPQPQYSEHGGGHGYSKHGGGYSSDGRRKSWLREIFD